MKNKLRINAVITTIAVVLCVILLNVVVGKICAKKTFEIDFTKERVYDFSEQTKSVMESLDKEVKVYALIPEDADDEYLAYVKEYLAKYESMSDKFSVEYIDPYTEPAFLSQYTKDGDSIDLGSLIVTCGDKFRVISYNSLFQSNSYTDEVMIDMETKMTSAVIFVTGHGNEVKVYFTTGHEETVTSNFMSFLEGEGYVCSELNLSKSDIPADASVVVIAGPVNDFTLQEIDMIDKFTDKGGDVILMAPLSGISMPEQIAKYIGDWGLEFGNDIITENDSARMINTVLGLAPAPEMQNHKITEKIIGQKIEYVAPESSSIITRENNIYGAVHSPLLLTSESAVSNKTDGSVSKDGPYCVALISSRIGSEGKTSSILSLGSLVSAEAPVVITQSTYANSDLLLNAVAYMTDTTNSLEIRAKKVSSDFLTMTETQVKLVTVLLLYVLPGIIFVVGIVVWLRRRYL